MSKLRRSVQGDQRAAAAFVSAAARDLEMACEALDRAPALAAIREDTDLLRDLLLEWSKALLRTRVPPRHALFEISDAWSRKVAGRFVERAQPGRLASLESKR